MAETEIGKYLTINSRICSGRLVFRGTRILVSDALELVQAGFTPEEVAEQYHRIIPSQAVVEAMNLVRKGVLRELPPRTRSAA